MSASFHVNYGVIEWPGLLVPFAAVVAEFRRPVRSALPAARLEGLLRDFLPPAVMEYVRLPVADGSFEEVAAAVANAVQDLAGSNGLDVCVARTGGDVCRIFLGFHDPSTTLQALQTGIDLTRALFDHVTGRPVAGRELQAKLERTAALMRMRQPDSLARALIRVARRRGIPVQPVSPGSRVWLLGQGSAACQFFEAGCHGDSITGDRLSRNKLLTNQLVTQLGFPGVTHGVVGGVEQARELARRIGYPVVVKPLDRGKGRGVTARIGDDAELAKAFAAANPLSPGRVLVERHVDGDDHRLTVFGGRFAWALRRLPPQVTGDGRHSIVELVDIENRRRAEATMADIVASPMTMDDDARRMLAMQGLAPEDRPAAGTGVVLGSIANVSRGGTVVDCTADIHPDNRAMAEAIARSFHLDSAGIDFMTTDIGRSWRDGGCAVIEVNATPGFASDEQLAVLFDAKFPAGSDGRLPAIVVIGADAALLERVAAALGAAGRRTGRTDGSSTVLGEEPRFADERTLPERVTALLLDPACEALVIGARPEDIERHGFPTGRCDLALVMEGAGLAEPLMRLVTARSGAVIDGVTAANLDGRVLPSISAMPGKRAG